ncbi:MAG: endonuclease domain-containing protein [Armatimonadota bacterium]
MQKRWRSSIAVQKRARELRKTLTPEEKLLWKHLAQRQLCGAFFRRQVPMGAYVLDFYCAMAKLAIELDGAPHLHQAVYDRERTEWLQEEKRVLVLRFHNSEVQYEINRVLSEIAQALQKRLPSPGGSELNGRWE